MKILYNDKYGNPLWNNQLYIAGDSYDGHIIHITLKEDGSFHAEDADGFSSIENPKLFASQLIRLANQEHQIEFARSKLEESL